MGAVGLYQSVVGVGIGKNLLRRAIVSADIHSAADTVWRKLVPEAPYACGSECGVIEIGIRHIKAYVHDADHHSLSGISLRQRAAVPHRGSIHYHCRGVHRQRVTPAGFNPQHTL